MFEGILIPIAVVQIRHLSTDPRRTSLGAAEPLPLEQCSLVILFVAFGGDVDDCIYRRQR